MSLQKDWILERKSVEKRIYSSLRNISNQERIECLIQMIHLAIELDDKKRFLISKRNVNARTVKVFVLRNKQTFVSLQRTATKEKHK